MFGGYSAVAVLFVHGRLLRVSSLSLLELLGLSVKWLLAQLRTNIGARKASFNLTWHIEHCLVKTTLIALYVLSVSKSVERASFLLLALTADLSCIAPHVDNLRHNLVVVV